MQTKCLRVWLDSYGMRCVGQSRNAGNRTELQNGVSTLGVAEAVTHFGINLEHQPQRVSVGSFGSEISDSLAGLLRKTETAANAVRLMTPDRNA